MWDVQECLWGYGDGVGAVSCVVSMGGGVCTRVCVRVCGFWCIWRIGGQCSTAQLAPLSSSCSISSS